MKVVWHRTVASDLDKEPPAALAKKSQEPAVVGRFMKNGLPIVATIDHVIETAGGSKSISSSRKNTSEGVLKAN